MDAMNEKNQPIQSKPIFPTGSWERRFGVAVLLSAILGANSVITCGFSLGFALSAVAVLLCSMGYLLASGGKLTPYRLMLLVLSVGIAASFIRSNDSLVKFFMVLFLLTGGNLAFCLMAEQNLRQPEVVDSLLDAPRAMFVFGWGKLTPALRGLTQPKETAKPRKNLEGLLPGLALAALVLMVLIPLLISADAAFESLMRFLPKIELLTDEVVLTVVIGDWMGLTLYTRGVALKYAPKQTRVPIRQEKTHNWLTVNIVLTAVVLVYVVFWLSHLAYLSGGFAGLLPSGYTLAEYARRGFFEMMLVCALNLVLILLVVRLAGKEGGSPRLAKLLSLCIGGFSLLFVASASAKMGLYIGEYGLTRLRVLTELIMLFLVIATGVVCAGLYLPKLPYMKVILVTALLIGGIVSWADVDTQVARYNVNAYLSGQLEQVDVDHLGSLSAGAVPYLAQLLEVQDAEVVEEARTALTRMAYQEYGVLQWNVVQAEESAWADQLVPREQESLDLRGWNLGYAQAYALLSELAQNGQLNSIPR